MPTTFPSPPLKPGPHAEHHLIEKIISGTYPPGTRLPDERSLAAQLGITRPTLRETLQRLAAQGWISINHGKPTRVNDIWQTGGMAVLGAMANHGGSLPDEWIIHLLQVRVQLMPGLAAMAAEANPAPLTDHLAGRDHLGEDGAAFAVFDWQLQHLMARHSGNPVYLFILNDFAPMFTELAERYFSDPVARKASRQYYDRLIGALEGQIERSIKVVVREAMAESMAIWNRIASQ